MNDVYQLLEQLKAGNYNNYVGESMKADSLKSPTAEELNQISTSLRRVVDETNSVVDGENTESPSQKNLGNNSIVETRSAVSQSIKGRRQLMIKRLEKEYLRLQKRFEQVTDPTYISELKRELK